MQEPSMDPPRSRDHKTTYEELALIGNGAYGTVYKARDLSTNQFVALKKIRIPSNSQEIGMPISAMREIATLKQIDCFNHPHIVKLLDVCPGNRQSSELQLYLVFEHIQQDLSAYIDNQPESAIPVPRIKRIVHETLHAIHFLHENRIVHRDIKPQNVLVTSQGQVKLADYGLSRVYSFHMALTSGVVTLWYRSPEVLLQDTYCSSVDIWSCACIMAELYLRRALFPGTSELTQLCKIFEIRGLPNEQEWPKAISLPWSSFLNSPKVPLTSIISGLCSNGEDIMEMMLTFDQSQRITARDALKHAYFDNREPPTYAPPPTVTTTTTTSAPTPLNTTSTTASSIQPCTSSATCQRDIPSMPTPYRSPLRPLPASNTTSSNISSNISSESPVKRTMMHSSAGRGERRKRLRRSYSPAWTLDARPSSSAPHTHHSDEEADSYDDDEEEDDEESEGDGETETEEEEEGDYEDYQRADYSDTYVDYTDSEDDEYISRPYYAREQQPQPHHHPHQHPQHPHTAQVHHRVSPVKRVTSSGTTTGCSWMSTTPDNTHSLQEQDYSDYDEDTGDEVQQCSMDHYSHNQHYRSHPEMGVARSEYRDDDGVGEAGAGERHTPIFEAVNQHAIGNTFTQYLDNNENIVKSV